MVQKFPISLPLVGRALDYKDIYLINYTHAHLTDIFFPFAGSFLSIQVYANMLYDASQADMWSLGVTLWILLTGCPLYEHPTLRDPNCKLAYKHGKDGLVHILRHWNMLDRVPEQAVDLLSLLLCPSGRRLNIHAVLLHPWVNEELRIMQEKAKENEEGEEKGEEEEEVKEGAEEEKEKENIEDKSNLVMISSDDGRSTDIRQWETVNIKSREEKEHENEKQHRRQDAVTPIPLQDGSNRHNNEDEGQGKEANGILQTPDVKSKHDGYTSTYSRRVLLTQEEENTETEDTWLLVHRSSLPPVTSATDMAAAATTAGVADIPDTGVLAPSPSVSSACTALEAFSGLVLTNDCSVEKQISTNNTLNPSIKSPPSKKRAIHSASP